MFRRNSRRAFCTATQNVQAKSYILPILAIGTGIIAYDNRVKFLRYAGEKGFYTKKHAHWLLNFSDICAITLEGDTYNEAIAKYIPGIKITFENECHNGFYYKTGENIDAKEFDSTMCQNGLHFTYPGPSFSYWYYGYCYEYKQCYARYVIRDPFNNSPVRIGGNKAKSSRLNLTHRIPLPRNIEQATMLIDFVIKEFDFVESGFNKIADFFSNKDVIDTTDLFDMLVHTGHLDDYSNILTCDDHIIRAAAGKGRLDILIWAHETIGQYRNWNWTWMLNIAAENDHLDVLIWAQQMGYELSPDICAAAAKRGHIHIIQWALCNGHKWNSSICQAAVRHSRLEVLTWARENGYIDDTKEYENYIQEYRSQFFPRNTREEIIW